MKRAQVFVALILFLFSIYFVGSVTRTLSDTQDNKETFIRNSNGKYWEPTGENLQAAIDDIGSWGTVWVGSDITLSSPIEFDGHDGVIIDFQNNEITLNGNTGFIELTATRFATVKNAKVTFGSVPYTGTVIKLYTPEAEGDRWADRCDFNHFENIYIRNPSPYAVDHDWTGIALESFSDSRILENSFKDIVMWGVGTGIRFHMTNEGTYISGNYFENIYIDRFETMVEFDATESKPYNCFNHNVFNHLKGQTSTYSRWGLKNIEGNGNHFDHLLTWDWTVAENPEYAIEVSDNSLRTYICAHYIGDEWMADNGLKTTVSMGD
ncbi:hypothetical protein K8R43_05235 [archaeon]|nr:hypothetical protein [archaeon]